MDNLLINLNELTYEYFRSTEYFRYLFDSRDNGLVVITGPNGCGKTSFILAIKSALYGLSKSNLMLGHENNTKLELKFTVRDHEYKIIRRKGGSVLYKDGEEFLSSVRDINHFMTGLIDPDIADATIFLSTKFIQLKDKQRKDIIDNLITVDFDKPREKASIYLNQQKMRYNIALNKIDPLEREISANRGEIERVEKELEEKRKERENKIREYRNRLIELDKLIDNYNSQISELKDQEAKAKTEVDNAQRQYYVLQDKVNKYKDLIRELESDKKDYGIKIEQLFLRAKSRSLDKYQIEIKQINSAINDLENTLQNINNEANKIQSEMKILINIEQSKRDDKIRQLEFEIQKLEHQYNMQSNSCPLCHSSLQDNDEMKEREYIDKFISEYDAKCPICGQDHREVVSNRSKFKEDIKNNINKLRSEIDKVNEQFKDFKKRKERECEDILNTYRDKWREFNKQLKIRQKQLGEVTRILQELESKYDVQDNIKLNESEMREYNTYVKSLRDIDVKLAELNQKLHTMTNNIQEAQRNYEQMREACDKISNKIEAMYNELNKTSQVRNDIASSLQILENTDIDDKELVILRDKLESNLRELEHAKKEIEEAEEKIKLSRIWYNAFGPKGIKASIINELLPIINNTLYEYGLKLDIIPQLVIDDKGRFLIEVTSSQRNGLIASNAEDLSTGEQQIVNVLFNIALSKIYPCNAVFFDEAFDGLDQNNAGLVMAILSQLAQKKLVFVITHSPVWKSFECDEVLTPGGCYEQ